MPCGRISASGIMPSTSSASAVSAPAQPMLSIRPCASGENTTCPNEPAAVPSPRMKVRRSGLTTRTIAASASENAEKAMPSPASTPAKRCSAPALSAAPMPHSPMA